MVPESMSLFSKGGKTKLTINEFGNLNTVMDRFSSSFKVIVQMSIFTTRYESIIPGII